METENFRVVEITDNQNTNEFLVLEEPLEDVIIHENGEAVFECKVEGQPKPVCFWYKNGKPITSSQRRKITSNRIWHRLEIIKVKPDDHGIYTVVLRNSVKQIFSKAVLFVAPTTLNKVLYSPANKVYGVTKHLCDVQTKVGTTIELEAEFQYETVTDYVWFKNNDIINMNDRTLVLNSKKSTNLSILKAETKDSGVYIVVNKTKHGILSSIADVQVIDNKQLEDTLPIIEELLPDEVETNEGEKIRLICKAVFNVNTKITWHKNDVAIDNDNFMAECYGNRYIGLKIIKPTRSDTAEYTVVIRDEETGVEESSSCFLTVNPSPSIFLPPVELRKPLESAIACCGCKVIFDCCFTLQDPKYFYVVWYVGRYRVERTNSQFEVICKGGNCLLYIKKLEPGMTGEVTCELRRALPNQRSIFVNSSLASLVIVPLPVIHDELNSIEYKGKIYKANSNQNNSIEVSIVDEEEIYGYRNLSSKSKSNGNGVTANCLKNESIIEITYCRLENNGTFYMQAVRVARDVEISRLLVQDKIQKDGIKTQMTVVAIEWEDSILPTSLWYTIEIAQNNDEYIEAGLTSLPAFELKDPPVGKMMKFRVKTVEPINGCCESNVCIEATPQLVLKQPKNLELQPMDEFEKYYTKTGDLIGCGAFGSVVLVRDETGEHYAAKILKTRTQKKRETATREFEMMKKLQHNKLVELIDAFVAKDAFILIMDYLWGGELFDRIVEEEHIKEVDVVPYVRQLCEALEYLHIHKIAHLDLKPENIICLSPNSGQVKIIDFGLARILEEGHITRAIYGTRDYVAPEVLNFERLTLACDMWSLGVVTYMLLSGVMPFAGDTWPERSANITMANYNYDETAFRDISDLAKEFVDQLLVLSAEKRMSAVEALNHKWITEGPPRGAKAGHMKRTRENLKSYLANYRARWQRAGNVMIAAHRLRTHAVGLRGVVTEIAAPQVT